MLTFLAIEVVSIPCPEMKTSSSLPSCAVQVALVLSLFFSTGDSLQRQAHRHVAVGTAGSSLLRSVTVLKSGADGNLNEKTVKDLKELLRGKGLSVTGLKKELIERLELLPAVEPDYLKAPIVKVLRKGSTLLRKTKVTLPDNISILVDGTDDDMRVVKVESRSQDNPDRTDRADAKRSPAPKSVTKLAEVPATKKFVKTAKVAYDIDDDDFLSQMMDDGDAIMSRQSTQTQQQRSSPPSRSSPLPTPERSVSLRSKAVIDSIEADGEDEGEENENPRAGKTAWPGPGVPWMSGPVVGMSGRSGDNGAKNSLMVPADDDLQRMVDER